MEMLLNFCVFTTLLQSGIAHAWNLRIDYFKKANDDAGIDKVNIAFVNTSQRSLEMDHAAIPTAYDKGDFNKIKEDLNNFAMVRRKKFISTPNFDFSRTIDRLNYNYVGSLEASDINTKEQLVEDIKFYRNMMMLNDLNKQSNFIKRVSSADTNAMMSNEHEFREILNSVEKFKASSSQTTTTVRSTQMSTYVALVDETEVRKALQNDPFVKRILKMAKNNNMKYLKQFSG